MTPRHIYWCKLLYVIVLRIDIVYSVQIHCLLVDCCIFSVFYVFILCCWCFGSTRGLYYSIQRVELIAYIMIG